MHVNLTEQQWQTVMGLISEGPWRVANPLLMEIGRQLQTQSAALKGDGKEVERGEQLDPDAQSTSH